MVLPTGSIANSPLSVQMRMLKSQGFEPVSFSDDLAEYSHPDQPGKAVLLALKPGVTRHYLDAARIIKGNPLFPRIDYTEEFAPGMHTISTEHLYRAEELPVTAEERIVYQGIDRAFALFMDGDKDHIEAHREMGRDYHLMQAALHIARTIRTQLASGENVVHFNTAGAPVRFRQVDRDDFRPVFAGAFSSATYPQASEQCLHLCNRFDQARLKPEIIRTPKPVFPVCRP